MLQLIVHLRYKSILKPWNALLSFVYHLDPIVVENLLAVLCLADKTLVEVE
jgi:hypothetical protein